MCNVEDVLVVEGVDEEPDFVSMGRGWSFFGSMKVTAQLQCLDISDPVNCSPSSSHFVHVLLIPASIVQWEGATLPQLQCQALSDPDAVCRYLAYRACSGDEKGRIITELM